MTPPSDALATALAERGLRWLAITWVVNFFAPGTYLPIHERALPFYALAALLLGAYLMSIGLIAELMTAYMSRDEDSYSIAERTGEEKP